MKLAMLRGFRGKNDVTIYSIPFCIGRCRSANFIIAHVNVSRNHCKIVKENEYWKICDFSSSGTYVNDELVGINETVVLNNGDRIRFGPIGSSLCWTFYSFDSSSENSKPEIKPPTRVTLDFQSENVCAEQKDVSHKKDDLDLKLKGSTCEVNQETETNNCQMTKGSHILKECSYVAKGKNINDNNDYKEIRNLTKELEEVQSIVNYFQEKNCALQMELATDAKSKTEINNQKNLLENVADLIETEFQCSICSELFVTAVTLNCTHTFCKYCIGQWKKKQKNCPICRKKITNETRSLVVDNYIDKVVENLSCEVKERREAIIKERDEGEHAKKKTRLGKKN